MPLVAAPDPSPAPPAKPLEGVRLLVVDDLPETRATLAAQGRRLGAGVETGAPEALARLLDKAKPFQVALVDLEDTPAVALRSLIERLGPERIVPLTRGPLDQARSRCDALALSPPLLKPPRATALLKALLTATGRATLHEESDAPVSAPVSLTPDQALAQGRLILVAEDNAINRRVISRQLGELGHPFDMASDGEVAWDMLRQKAYGLLLTDCLMPRLDGYDLTRRIRQQESKGGPRLPVIALTANAVESEMQRCRDAGMDDFLTKPVALETLGAILDEWLPSTVSSPVSVSAVVSQERPVERVLDLRKFADIIGTDDPETVREFMGFFVETFDQALPPLHAALAAHDRPALRQAAHAAKGAARNACALVLAARLDLLEEQSITEASFEDLAPLLAAVETAYADVRALIQAPEAPPSQEVS